MTMTKFWKVKLLKNGLSAGTTIVEAPTRAEALRVAQERHPTTYPDTASRYDITKPLKTKGT
jgi:hypothetical protein